MAIYQVKIVTPGTVNANAPYCVLRTAAAGAGSLILLQRCKVIVTAATPSQVGLILLRGAGSSLGTASASVLGQARRKSSPASVTNVDTAWSVAPTLPSSPIYLDASYLGGTAGNGENYTWTDEPLELAASGGNADALALWNIGGGAGGPLQVTFTWGE